ncbi:nucleoside recognition domain-containing protein [Staphylococcus lutrae]|uniref:Transporter n=1 Tax=Staphylococcus lutrae TaxID=155085 RepID=A0AAC9WJ19_9STAP|nr:nucleoside recognition domain-containing protein [Staphylococcus lutrae]ARJ50775.1 transporter [Staphylococcus lutrae]PNZ36132.1 ferrous iron transporter B [Staphylococcus lutrae]
MLTVVYDLFSGRVTPIPQGPHQLQLCGWNKLDPVEQQALKRWIIKHRLEVSLKHPVPSHHEQTQYIVRQLQLFWHEQQAQRPTLLQTVLGWLCIFGMFALPVYGAYHFSEWFQNHYIAPWITRIAQAPVFEASLVQALLFGDYGVLSLGTYSLVWALPVVVLLSLSTALINQSHLKPTIIWAITPTMRKVGLAGTDIIPVLEGFGCNAAAIVQAGHQCHHCTKARCMSLISFGTSCSYQIGATLSIFNVAHQSWLFLPYIALVLIGGVIHNRLWYPTTSTALIPMQPLQRQTLVWPSFRRTVFEMWGSVRMFILQALPIFIAICFLASSLALTPLLEGVSQLFIPILNLLQLPHELSPGLLFSMIRKDGMLLFNLDHGSIIQKVSAIQLLVLVFFSSTFTACSVTMTMVLRQLGIREGCRMILRQMVTSLIIVVLCGILLI